MVALRNNLRPAVEADCSGLSFLKLSCTILIIGVFWMVVQLHAYVVWLRAGEKALLLFAMIVSCIGIFLNDRLPSNVHQINRKIVQLYWVFTLSMITLLVIYLAISEPSPLSVLFPDRFIEVPGARGLQIEGLVIIFLILVPFGGALAGIRIETISRHLPIYIISFCIACLCVRFMSFIYYACGSNFTFAFQTCHVGIADIGGTTLNAVHAVQKGINPYTIDIQGNYTNSPYRGYRYWPMMFTVYMPLVSLFTTGWGAMRLTNLALDVITAALIVVLVRRRSGWLPGVLGASLYLMLPMLPMRLYRNGGYGPRPDGFTARGLGALPKAARPRGSDGGLVCFCEIYPWASDASMLPSGIRPAPLFGRLHTRTDPCGRILFVCSLGLHL